MACDLPEQENQLPQKLLDRDAAAFSESGGSSMFGSVDSSISSSGISTPFESELRIEDEDFIAELTRQMADYMLLDEDDDEKVGDEENGADFHRIFCEEEGGSVLADQSSSDSAETFGYQPLADELMRPIQVYQLNDQPVLRKQGSAPTPTPGKAKVATEAEQQKAQPKRQNNVQSTKGRTWVSGHGGKVHFPQVPSQVGSGMQAVFLGGSCNRTGSTGTGVFLPRVTDNPVKPKKKSGCSTVLIPTRVLHALQLHFKQMDASNGSHDTSGKINGLVPKQNKHSESQTPLPANSYEEFQLPQEWTY